MSDDIRTLFQKRSCALIGYPEPWDSGSVAVVVAQRSRFDLWHAVVVTWNPVVANKTLEDSSFKKENISIKDYNSATELLSLSNNLIVFDSLQELMSLTGRLENKEINYGVDILPNLIKRKNIVIVLITSGVTRNNLDLIGSQVPGAYFMWSTFLERPQHLQFTLHECDMTPEQDLVYSVTRKKELASEPDNTSYESSQKVCNILLPESVREVMDTDDEPTVENMMKIYPSKDLLINAPKIRNLITQLRLYPDMRHVIFTRYECHHGVRMLFFLLKDLGFNTYSVSKNNEHKDNIKNITSFNRDEKPAIMLVSTKIPRGIGFKNISHLHFLDSCYEYYHILMEEIFKYKNYTAFVCNLFVHSYVCHKSGINHSADKILYDSFVKFQTGSLTTWDAIRARGYPLVMGNNDYLAATTFKSSVR